MVSTRSVPGLNVKIAKDFFDLVLGTNFCTWSLELFDMEPTSSGSTKAVEKASSSPRSILSTLFPR